MPGTTERKRPSNYLLSHRLRGFSPHEGSLSALRAAMESTAVYLEIDTRLTADRQILVLHDTRLERLTERRGRVRNYRIDESGLPPFRGEPREPLATLAEFLRFFRDHRRDQVLWVDIKDAGAEREHWDLIQQHGLENCVKIVSWTPEVLLRFRELAPAVPLCFSFVPMARWQLLFRIVQPLLRWRRLTGLASACGIRSLRDVRICTGPEALGLAEGADLPWGENDVRILDGLPTGRLADCLRLSRGAVGVPASLVTPEFVHDARAQGLRSYVFSVDRADRLRALMETCDPDIVFTNRADFFRAGGESPGNG